MAQPDSSSRYQVADLISFTTALFSRAGCDGDKPAIIAEGLVEADLLGHTTHGLQLAAPYLAELESQRMTAVGEPEIIAERSVAITWDGRRLPGIWLTRKGVDLAAERAKLHGMAAVSIRRSHHIGCLAAFLQRATDQGLLITIASSDPAGVSVAPYGGRKPVFTPDPIAIGIPTQGDPILIDISASITTNGLANRLRREGKPFPGHWAMDAEGQPTADPEALFTDPPGTLLPVGGIDHGHKGYGMALLVETLTQGLSGYGRADSPTGWGASVFIQVFDPAAFGGLDAFRRQTGWLAEACRSNPPRPGINAVRLPGENGLHRKRQALSEGVPLYPGILESLVSHAQKYDVKLPEPIV